MLPRLTGFFPRTGAWENLKKALKGDYEETVWDHLAGTVSAPFEVGEHGQVAVKVIDDRGNELLIVKSVKRGEEMSGFTVSEVNEPILNCPFEKPDSLLVHQGG